MPASSSDIRDAVSGTATKFETKSVRMHPLSLDGARRVGEQAQRLSRAFVCICNAIYEPQIRTTPVRNVLHRCASNVRDMHAAHEPRDMRSVQHAPP